MKHLLILPLALLALMGCRSAKSAQSLTGRWVIDTAMGITARGGDDVAFIQFAEDGKMNGCSSVNLFNAGYTLQKGNLHFTPVAMTRRMGRSMNIETAVTQALGAAARVKVKGQQAYILDEKNDTVMVLAKE